MKEEEYLLMTIWQVPVKHVHVYCKICIFFNEGGSHKLLHIHVMTNYKKAVNSLPVVSLIGAHFSPSGKGNLPLYSLCCSG